MGQIIMPRLCVQGFIKNKRMNPAFQINDAKYRKIDYLLLDFPQEIRI